MPTVNRELYLFRKLLSGLKDNAPFLGIKLWDTFSLSKKSKNKQKISKGNCNYSKDSFKYRSFPKEKSFKNSKLIQQWAISSCLRLILNFVSSSKRANKNWRKRLKHKHRLGLKIENLEKHFFSLIWRIQVIFLNDHKPRKRLQDHFWQIFQFESN